MKRVLSTLRGRIVLAATLSTLVVLVGVGGLVLAGARRDARTDLDRRLKTRATQIAALPAMKQVPRLGRPVLPPLRNVVLASDDLGVRVIVQGRLGDATGNVPVSEPVHLPTRAGVRTFRVVAGDRRRAATVLVAGRPGMFVEVMAPTSVIDESVRSLRRRVVIVGLLGLLVGIALASAAATYAVRSLGRLRRAADEVSETDRLDLRIPEDGPAEVHAVAHALNAMLARLEVSAAERERALESTKRFAADAGHELRTPLAVLQTGLETLARNPDLPVDERQEIVDETLAEHRRLSELVIALQALTRGEGGAMGDEQDVDLADVVGAAATVLRHDHPAVRLTLDVDPRTPTVVASLTGVRLLVDNLLRNAAHHGADPDGEATIHVVVSPEAPNSTAAGGEPRNPGARLVVDDDGPGIPAADLPRLTDRFVRGSAASAAGSGLGLAIAAQQAHRLGGELEIGRSPSGGARFAATLRPPTRVPSDAGRGRGHEATP